MIVKQYQDTQCGGALQTARRRNGEKTRRYRNLQSATTKIHFSDLQCSQAKYLQITFGGAKPNDLNDTLLFLTKEHLKAFIILPYAKWSLQEKKRWITDYSPPERRKGTASPKTKRRYNLGLNLDTNTTQTLGWHCAGCMKFLGWADIPE